MTSVTQQQRAGDFDWRADPNYRFEAPKAPEVEPVAVPVGGGGSSVLDTTMAFRQMRDGKGAPQSKGGALLREARTAVGDGIGKVVGALVTDRHIGAT